MRGTTLNIKFMSLNSIIMPPVLHCYVRNFFIEPLLDTQRKERQGERGIWVAMSRYCFTPPLPSLPPSSPSPHCASVALPAAMLSGLAEGRLLPPSLSPTHVLPIAEFEQFSATSAKSEGGLRLGA